MTPDEIRQVATRRGCVRWDKSGILEVLRVTTARHNSTFFQKGQEVILVKRLLGGAERPLYPRKKYYCKEVRGNETILVGDLLL